MKNTIQKSTPNFFSKNKDLIIAGSAIALLAGAGYTWFYLKKKKENTTSNEISQAQLTTSKAANFPINRTQKSSPIISKGNAQIKYGSRGAEVKILQRYLKIYKEDLGNSGANKDGVDGIFGPKTARAAKKRLGKAVFSQSDINGMKRTLKTMGK